MSARVLFSLLLLAILWGSAFPFIKIGLEGLSAPHLTLARHLIASLCFLPFLWLSKKRLFPNWRDVPYFFLVGGVGIAVYHLSLNFGELFVSAGATSLIIATAPAITAVIAYFMLAERLPLWGWLGSAVSFFGVFLIVMGDSRNLGLNPYALLVLISAVATSFFFVLQKRLLTRYKPVEVTAFATWAGTVPMLLFLPGFAADIANAAVTPLLAAFYLGVFPSAIAYSLIAFAFSQAPVLLVTNILYTVPVFSLLFSWLLLGEVPTLLTLIGGLIAIAGIVIVNRAKRRSQRQLRQQVATD